MNQSLVDDGLVDMDKIGSSNFFWSFPSKVAVTKQNRVDSLKHNIAQVLEEGPAGYAKSIPYKRGRQTWYFLEHFQL